MLLVDFSKIILAAPFYSTINISQIDIPRMLPLLDLTAEADHYAWKIRGQIFLVNFVVDKRHGVGRAFR